MELLNLLLLTTHFVVQQDIVWDIRCSSGRINICELKKVRLTPEIADQRTFFPATNLRILDGWIPSFDSTLAGMLRRETKILVMIRCHVEEFVVREMLRVLILAENLIESVRLFETGEEFEMEWLKIDKNDISNISFVSRMTKLYYLNVSGNKLEVLELNLFQNMQNLSMLLLAENRIKSIEASPMIHLPVKIFNVADNQLTNLYTKNWYSNNLTFLSIDNNNIQSVNTVQLRKSAPKISQITYHSNPWNCKRLDSLQFYLDTKQVWNFTMSFAPNFAQCHDRDSVRSVAFKLPELVDLTKRKLSGLENTIHELIEDREEKRLLDSLQLRFSKTQQTLLKMTNGLSNLGKTRDTLRNSVEWLDFFDNLK